MTKERNGPSVSFALKALSGVDYWEFITFIFLAFAIVLMFLICTGSIATSVVDKTPLNQLLCLSLLTLRQFAISSQRLRLLDRREEARGYLQHLQHRRPSPAKSLIAPLDLTLHLAWRGMLRGCTKAMLPNLSCDPSDRNSWRVSHDLDYSGAPRGGLSQIVQRQLMHVHVNGIFFLPRPCSRNNWW